MSAAKEVVPKQDRRKNARTRMLIRGLVCDPAGAPNYTCAIRELTPNGARITVPTGQKASPEIFLVNVRARMAYEAILLWHNNVEAGYALLNAIALSESGDARSLHMLSLCGAPAAA